MQISAERGEVDVVKLERENPSSDNIGRCLYACIRVSKLSSGPDKVL